MAKAYWIAFYRSIKDPDALAAYAQLRRLLAVRLVSRALDLLSAEFAAGTSESHYLGLVKSKVTAFPVAQMMAEMDVRYRRPKEQWWLELQAVLRAVADAAV